MSRYWAQKRITSHFKRGFTLESVVSVGDIVKCLQQREKVVEITSTVERVSCEFTHHEPVEDSEGRWIKTGQLIR